MRSKTKALESLLSLFVAARGYTNKDLTPAQSVETIQQNTVRIVNLKTGWNGAGLRVTNDGYILTADHVFDPWKRDWQELLKSRPSRNLSRWYQKMGENYSVIINEQESYPLEIATWYTHLAYDIGLLKARIPQDPCPVKFKLRPEPVWGEEVTLYSRDREGTSIPLRTGSTTSLSERFQMILECSADKEVYDSFETTIPVWPGDSGSPVVSSEGELLGIAISSSSSSSKDDERGLASCAKIKYLVEVVDYVIASKAELLFR